MCWKHSRAHCTTNPKTGTENICTHPQAHKLIHIYCMLTNVTDCHLRMQLWIFCLCAYWNAIPDRRCLCICLMGKQQRAGGWRKRLDACCLHYSSGQMRFSANGEGYKVYIWYQTTIDIRVKWEPLKTFLANKSRCRRGRGYLALPCLQEHLSTLIITPQWSCAPLAHTETTRAVSPPHIHPILNYSNKHQNK